MNYHDQVHKNIIELSLDQEVYSCLHKCQMDHSLTSVFQRKNKLPDFFIRSRSIFLVTQKLDGSLFDICVLRKNKLPDFFIRSRSIFLFTQK